MGFLFHHPPKRSVSGEAESLQFGQKMTFTESIGQEGFNYHGCKVQYLIQWEGQDEAWDHRIVAGFIGFQCEFCERFVNLFRLGDWDNQQNPDLLANMKVSVVVDDWEDGYNS